MQGLGLLEGRLAGLAFGAGPAGGRGNGFELQPAAAAVVVKHQQGWVPGRPQLGHGRPAPVGSRLHPGAGLVAEPAQPLAALLDLLEGFKWIPGPGLSRQTVAAEHLQRPRADAAEAAQVGTVAIEPDQPRRAPAAGQGHRHVGRFTPGQGLLHRLARSGRPTSIKAASRMRQLSQIPQGCSPPL